MSSNGSTVCRNMIFNLVGYGIFCLSTNLSYRIDDFFFNYFLRIFLPISVLGLPLIIWTARRFLVCNEGITHFNIVLNLAGWVLLIGMHTTITPTREQRTNQSDSKSVSVRGAAKKIVAGLSVAECDSASLIRIQARLNACVWR